MPGVFPAYRAAHPQSIPKAWYLSYFASSVCIFPYLNLYFNRELGISAAQIGLLAALRPWLSAAAGPVMSAFADQNRAHRLLLLWGLGLSFIVRSGLAFATTLPVVAALVLLSEIISAPVHIMVDTSVMAASKDEDDYGRQRMWGAIGWGTMSFVAGAVVTRVGVMSAFLMYFIGQSITLAVSALLDFGPLYDKAAAKRLAGGEAGEGAALTGSPDAVVAVKEAVGDAANAPVADVAHATLVEKLKPLLKDPAVLLFIFKALIMGMGCGAIEGYLFLYLHELGGSETLMGLTLTFTCIAETPMFYFVGRIIKNLGVQRTLDMVLAAFVIRTLCYSNLASWGSPWAVLPVELLHGVTFACAWAAGSLRSAQLAPAGLEATMQGLFQSVYGGVGAGIGGLISGVIYNECGGRFLYLCVCSWTVLGWAICALGETYLLPNTASREEKPLEYGL